MVLLAPKPPRVRPLVKPTLTPPTEGQIAGLNSGYFGSAIIAKSITIDCMGHNASTNAVSISGNAIVVVLRGLNIYGFFTQNLDTGVSFGNGQELHIEHSTITGFTNGNIGGTAAGIRMSAGGGRLFVSDTVVSLNGTASNGGGIIIEPSGSGNRRVVLNRVQVTNNSGWHLFRWRRRIDHH